MKLNNYTRIILISLALSNILYLYYFLNLNGYLPAPFFYLKQDTFMDFYNPLSWLNTNQIYSDIGSVYPPLNFLILKLLTLFSEKDNSSPILPLEIRNLWGKDIIFIIFLYYITILISFQMRIWQRLILVDRLSLGVMVLASLPLLYAIERGNLIILCVLFLTLYISTENDILKTIYISLLINLKPYFFIIYLLELSRKNTYLKFTVPLISLLIYLISGTILDEDYYLMPFNILGFGVSSSLFSAMDIINFPSTVLALSSLTKLIPIFDLFSIIMYLLKVILYFYLFKLIRIFFQKKLNDTDFMIGMIIIITNVSISVGGYCILFYIPLIPIIFKYEEYKNLRYLLLLFFIGMLGFIPIYNFDIGSQFSYLSQSNVMVNLKLALGSILNPVVNFIILLKFYERNNEPKIT
jgi:hypothetical protein